MSQAYNIESINQYLFFKAPSTQQANFTVEHSMAKEESFSDWMSELSRLKQRFANNHLIDAVFYWKNHEFQSRSASHKQLIDEMIQRGIFPEKFSNGPYFNIGAFKHIKHLEVLDYIKQQPDWTEDIKSEAITYYQRFASWLGKYSLGDFNGDTLFHLHRNTLWNEGDEITFMKWRAFIEGLGKKNKRDEIIGRALLQGKRRVSDVLKLTIDKVNFDTGIIRYKSNKKDETVHYESTFIKELKNYIASTEDIRKDSPYIFITRTGKPLSRRRLNYSFNHVCDQKKMRRIAPDELRHLWDKLKKGGYSDAAIMYSKEARIEEGAKEMAKRLATIIKQEASK